jgi:exonuclease SbcC
LVAAGLPADGTVDAAALAAHGEALRAAAIDLAEHRTALDALAAVAERLRAIGTGIERIEIAANEAAEEVSSVSTSVDALASDVEQTPLREVAATAAARILRQREGFDDAERRAESALEAARRATALLDEVTTRFISGIAPRLASALAPGEPCPVCGAIEHPQPAAGHPDATVGPSELESAQSAAHAAMVAQGTSVSELHALRLELGDAADRPLAEVRAEAAAAAASLAASRAAAQQAQRHADRLQVLRDSLDRLSAERAAFELERARLDERRDLSQAVVTRLEPVVQRWAAIDVGAGVRALAEAERWSGEVARLEVDVSVAVARDDDASGALDLALVASGLPSAEAAAALALTAADLAALEARVDAWHREAADIEASLQALADDDLPDVAPDASTDIARAERLARELAAARDDLVRMRHHADAASTSLDAATREAAASAGIRAEFQQAETVARTCAGQGPGRIALESWVLATELDRVAAAANVHLTRMSAGRYQLLRTDDAGHAGKQAGLDLAVLDSHTGRQRPTTTLSGGEQFEASLSLALGLADVVGNTAGASAAGFDALFVDEGFGSLDPDALDLAISALDELRDGGRVVGVITHVEALKAALPIGVEVRPRTDGNGSTLRVHSPEASSSRR